MFDTFVKLFADADMSSLKHFSFWKWLGHVAPMTALFVLVLFDFFAPDSWHDFLLILIATTFATTTFVFWWWVVYSLKKAYEEFNILGKRLAEVNERLADTQKLVKERVENIEEYHNHEIDGDRERTKSTKRKSKKS